MTGSLAVYYEHPDWFLPLFAELDARNISLLEAGCVASFLFGRDHWQDQTRPKVRLTVLSLNLSTSDL